MDEMNSRARPSDQALAVPVEPASSLAPTGFDPSRVRDLLEALAPLCAVIADYVTHAGPIHEPHDRILGRIGRGKETPPYLTWGQVCVIEDAAWAVARDDVLDTLLTAIAMEARRGETENTGSTAEGGDSAGRQASPKDHRHG